MTLYEILDRWASIVRVTTDTSTTPPSEVVTIDEARNAAKCPQMRGYIECSVTNTDPGDLASKQYPFELVFHSADGSPYTLDMKASDDRSVSGYAGTGEPGQSGYTNEAVAGKYVPVNNTLLKLLAGSDWAVGAAADFAATNSNNAVW